MADPDRLLLAVLIDADNVPAAHAEAIMEEIAALGEPALRRVFGDWTNPALRKWADKIPELGLVAHQESANTKGKNASDIGLVIDAMDILHSKRFGGFVLVSSDSDFTRLANRIREEGLRVYGIGEGKTPRALRNACNRFILIENIIGENKPDAQPKAKTKGQTLPDAARLMRLAFDKIDSEDEWVSLGQIGQALQAAEPDFDPRTFGCKKLSDLVAKLTTVELRKEGQRALVRQLD